MVTGDDLTLAPLDGEVIVFDDAYAVPGRPISSEPLATEAAIVSTPSLRMVVTA
jgi:hypothetical protein